MWRLTYTTEALKALARMDQVMARRVRARVLALAQDPRAKNNNVTKLSGVDGFRLRVGEWRVVYTLKDSILTVVVIRIGHRSEVYR